MPALTRRQFTLLPGAMLAAQAPSFAPPAFAQFSSAVITRPIPSTGEVLPAIGFGTAEVFGIADAGTLQKASGVVRARLAPMTKPERLVSEVAGLL